MNRTHVICHMYVSIDGKIDGEYMDEHGCDISGEFYDDEIWKMSNANGSGSRTCHMYFANEEIDYSKYGIENITYDDFVIKSDYYWVVFDRYGKCNWNTNNVEYGGKTANVLMVLTKKVKKEYIAHLRKLNISYIFAGEEDMDLTLALIKLKSKYGIDKMVLSGGATINGEFHKCGLLDELSIVMAPYIEGNHNEKGYLELSSYVGNKYEIKEMKKLGDGGIHLVFERK